MKQSGDSLSRRIWKYKFHYVIVMPALLLIFAFKIRPFVGGVLLPFVDTDLFRGPGGGSWAGMKHVAGMLGDTGFWNAFANTLWIKGFYILVSGLAALGLALALSAVRSGKLRAVFSTLFLMPYFIPSVVVAYVVALLLFPANSPWFRMETLVLANPLWIRPLLVIVEVLKTCGIPILVALAAIFAARAAEPQDGKPGVRADFMRMNVIPAVRAVAAFMLLQLSTVLSPDPELAGMLSNPLVYETGDTLDAYYFRTAFAQMNTGAAGAVWLFQFVVQLLFTLLAYVLVRRYFKRNLFGGSGQPPQNVSRSGTGNGIGIAVSSLYGLITLLLVFLLFVYPFFAHSSNSAGLVDIWRTGPYVTYVVLVLVAVLVNLFVTLTLAYPLTARDLPGRTLYKVFLFCVLGMGAGTLHEFMHYQNMGMMNTYFPLVFHGFFSIVSVFVLKSIFNSRYAALKEQLSSEGRGELYAFFSLFVPKVWKPLLALGVLQFVAVWNTSRVALVYINTPDRFPPLLHFRNLMMSGEAEAPAMLLLGALISLPPLALLLLFRRWLTSEVLLSQIRKL